MGKNARQIAMEILVRMQRDAAYSNLTLDAALRRNELPARDAALVSALVYGVEERLYTIDYQLSLYLKQPLKKLKPEVLAALRLGVCQLLFMERIPSSAAVCESVSLVKQNGCAFAAGLVNAVLRKVSDAGICLPEQEADALQMLSIRYSFPEWLIEKWLNAYGRENTLSILEACMAPAPLTVRVNTLQTTAEKLTVLLRQDHVAAHAARGCGRCFGFRSRGCDRAHKSLSGWAFPCAGYFLPALLQGLGCPAGGNGFRSLCCAGRQKLYRC